MPRKKPINKLQKELIAGRKRTEETLQAVADIVRTSKSHIWELENDDSINPKYELLKALVRHYRIDPKKIF